MPTKLKIASLLLFCLIAFAGHGQVKFRVKKLNADSLSALIPQKKGTEQIDAMNLLSNVICRNDFDSSMNLANRAIKLSEKLDYKKGLADGYFNIGNVYFLLDTLEPTITNYLKAYRIYEDLEPSEEFGNLCMQLFIINYFSIRIEAALQYSHQAIRIYKKIDDMQGQAMATWVSAIQGYIDKWDTAFYFTRRALIFLDTDRDRNEIAYIYNSEGEMYQAQFLATKDTAYFNLALYWFFKALNVKGIDKDVASLILTGIGKEYLDLNDKDSVLKGMEYLQKADLISDSSFDAYDWKPTIYRLLGRSCYSLGDYEKAIYYFKKGIQIINERASTFSINAYREPDLALNFKRHHKQLKPGFYSALSKSYEKLGDYQKALEYYALNQEAEDETYTKKYSDLLTLMEVTSKDEKNQGQIALLARDNELKALAIKQSRTLNMGIAGVFIILILIGLLFLRQNKMKNEYKTVLLEQKLLRLQMNPHFIFNALSNILNFIDGKENEKASNYLTTFSKLLRTTLENTREDMVPFEKEVGSLTNYLELQKLRYRDKFEYHVEVDEKIDAEEMSIPPMLVLPFIENAIEHGIRHKKTPGRIDVRFSLRDKKILCEVEDDGVGRARAWEAEVKERIGHKSLATEIIRDRIATLNKKFRNRIKLEIIDKTSESKESLGTKVLIDLPYGTVL